MQAKLIVTSGNTNKSEIKLKLPCTIGRGSDATITVNHQTVSRYHCEIYELEGALVLRDKKSTNGTFMEEERVTEVVLRPGAMFTVGPITFRADYEHEGEFPLVGDEAQQATAKTVDSLDFLAAAEPAASAPELDFELPGEAAQEEAVEATMFFAPGGATETGELEMPDFDSPAEDGAEEEENAAAEEELEFDFLADDPVAPKAEPPVPAPKQAKDPAAKQPQAESILDALEADPAPTGPTDSGELASFLSNLGAGPPAAAESEPEDAVEEEPADFSAIAESEAPAASESGPASDSEASPFDFLNQPGPTAPQDEAAEMPFEPVAESDAEVDSIDTTAADESAETPATNDATAFWGAIETVDETAEVDAAQPFAAIEEAGEAEATTDKPADGGLNFDFLGAESAVPETGEGEESAPVAAESAVEEPIEAAEFDFDSLVETAEAPSGVVVEESAQEVEEVAEAVTPATDEADEIAFDFLTGEPQAAAEVASFEEPAPEAAAESDVPEFNFDVPDVTPATVAESTVAESVEAESPAFDMHETGAEAPASPKAARRPAKKEKPAKGAGFSWWPFGKKKKESPKPAAAKFSAPLAEAEDVDEAEDVVEDVIDAASKASSPSPSEAPQFDDLAFEDISQPAAELVNPDEAAPTFADIESESIPAPDDVPNIVESVVVEELEVDFASITGAAAPDPTAREPIADDEFPGFEDLAAEFNGSARRPAESEAAEMPSFVETAAPAEDAEGSDEGADASPAVEELASADSAPAADAPSHGAPTEDADDDLNSFFRQMGMK